MCGRKFSYFGTPLDKKREMQAYAYSKIFNLSLNEFQAKFNVKFDDVFRKQLAVLKKLGMISINNEEIMINNKHFRYCSVIRTLFIDKDYIRRVLSNSKEKYDPAGDYSKILKKLTRLLGAV